MNEADYQTMLDLAAEMQWREAVNFIRAQTALSLTEARWVMEGQLRHKHPDCLCVRSLDERDAWAKRNIDTEQP